MLRWLTRFFGERNEAETAPAAPPPLERPPTAAAEPTPSDAVAVAEPVEALKLVELPEATAEVDVKETCPTCGKTGAFAGPPGQRFCTYCALRDELFERSAAATE